MGWMNQLRLDAQFVRNAARTYGILRTVRPTSETTLADFIEERVRAAPHRIAILYEDQKVTNAELEAGAVVHETRDALAGGRCQKRIRRCLRSDNCEFRVERFAHVEHPGLRISMEVPMVVQLQR